MNTDNEIDDFLAGFDKEKIILRKSILEPHKKQILELKNRGYAERIIIQFLEERKGIKVSQSYLNWFIRKHRKPNTRTVANAKIQTKGTEKEVKVKTETNQNSNLKNRPSWAKDLDTDELF